MSPAANDRRYVRAVESAWSRVLGRAALVSPREYEAIDGWRRRGVPLAVVLEVIGDVGKRRSGSPPRALTAIARAVEEAWSVVAAGRMTSDPAGGTTTPFDATRAWEDARDGFADGTPLHALLSLLLEAVRTGASGTEADAELDRQLPVAVPGPLAASATEETLRELADFRRRMSDEEFEKLFARARVDRLRAALGLPRLALTR